MTGATGYIGGAVAKALHARGHELGALVRPDAEARELRDLGAFLLSGTLESLPSLREQLDSYDAFVHTAAARDDRAEADRIAVDTFTSMGRTFVYTSGVWVLGNTSSADESSATNPLSIVAWRPAHEERVIAAGGCVIRPGCVYGGKQSLLADWFAAAQQERPLHIVGDGTNRWAMVELTELSDLYARAVEQSARGMLHGIDDSHATLEECARAVAPNGTIEKTPADEARAKLGPFVDALVVDQVIASDATRARTGWSPRRTFVGSVSEQWEEWRTVSSRA